MVYLFKFTVFDLVIILDLNVIVSLDQSFVDIAPEFSKSCGRTYFYPICQMTLNFKYSFKNYLNLLLIFYHPLGGIRA